MNAGFLRLSAGELADLLVRELERAGAVRRDGEWVATA
jgi:hypothetical protein